MRGFNIIILLGVLFITPYAFAQIPSCLCDTVELNDGTTGNDIIEELCPGGVLGADTNLTFTNDTIAISTIDFAYFVSEVKTTFCEVAEPFIPTSNAAGLTVGQYHDCRVSLIERCGLIDHNIPTLSEWGMIAMAGVLGVTGLYIAARRRKATA